MRQHAGTRVTSILDGANAILGEGSRIPDGGTKLPAELAIASEGALTLIGASFNKLVFPAILRSRRRPMQEASAYGAERKLMFEVRCFWFCPTSDLRAVASQVPVGWKCVIRSDRRAACIAAPCSSQARQSIRQGYGVDGGCAHSVATYPVPITIGSYTVARSGYKPKIGVFAPKFFD